MAGPVSFFVAQGNFTASIASTTLTVTVAPVIPLAIGQAITGQGVAVGTIITALGTGTGGNGTYTVNNSQTVASTSMLSGVVALSAGDASGLPVAATPPALPFTPISGATVAVTVGPAATSPSIALAASTATSYRVRNAAASASPVAFKLATSSTATPALPVPYSASGAGGTVGDKMIDPGGVEIIGLSAAQQAALAAGTLYLSAITPAGGSATLYITLGTGA